MRLFFEKIKKKIIKKNNFFNKFCIEILKKISNKIELPDKNFKIKSISIDTSNFHTAFCQTSMKFVTDKSPYNGLQSYTKKESVGSEDHYGKALHRHAYTGIYHFLFNEIKNLKLNICEIGILQNESIKMLKQYFKNSNIYGFENNLDLLKKAKSQKLQNVFYEYVDVTNDQSLRNTFQKKKIKFDIIIDDSTHDILDQKRIIKICHNYLKKKGCLIIEDIFKKKNFFKSNRLNEIEYYKNFKPYLKHYSDFFFIDSIHKNEFSPLWNNSKLFILKKF